MDRKEIKYAYSQFSQSAKEKNSAANLKRSLNKIFSFYELLSFPSYFWPKPNEFQRNIK
jgi:hypothetical protein